MGFGRLVFLWRSRSHFWLKKLKRGAHVSWCACKMISRYRRLYTYEHRPTRPLLSAVPVWLGGPGVLLGLQYAWSPDADTDAESTATGADHPPNFSAASLGCGSRRQMRQTERARLAGQLEHAALEVSVRMKYRCAYLPRITDSPLRPALISSNSTI